MKKNILFAAVIAVATLFISASCEKQDIVDAQSVSGAKVFTASIEQVQTKTTLGTVETRPGEYEKYIFWDKRDSILINKESYYVAEPNSEKPGRTDFLHTGGPEPEAPYEAIFPASLYVNSDFSNFHNYCFPGVQQYRAGKFNAPMYAFEDEGHHLIFQSICGVICFSLKGTEKIKKIEISSADKYLHGPFKIVEDNGDYTAELDPTAGEFYDNHKTVTLDCGANGVQLSKEDSTDFFIYLPENQFDAGDLSVRVTTADDKVFEKTAASSFTIQKNHVYTFNWEVDATLLNSLAKFFKGLSEDQAKLAAATDEAMRPLSEEEIANINANPAKAKQIFLPEIHTWSNARPAIIEIEKSIAKIDNGGINLMGLTKPELRFLEAYLYFELARTYGQAPIVTLENPNPQAALLTELMTFILKNAEDAAGGLQKYRYAQDEATIELAKGIVMTRPLNTAALALSARASLYFASPLFAQSTNYNTTGLKETKKYCEEIMTQGLHELNSSGYDKSWEMDYSNRELIFGVSFTSGSDAYAGLHPTQSMVDKYLGLDGNPYIINPINPSEGMFSVLDPRCNFTINVPTSTAGYTLKKPMSTFLPIFRYAEIMLDYAEAQVGLDQQADGATYIAQIRARAGIPPLTHNPEVQDIMAERSVELAFEGHRFWDARRWNSGGEFGHIEVAEVTEGTGGLEATRRSIALSWSPEYNFYPTPW